MTAHAQAAPPPLLSFHPSPSLLSPLAPLACCVPRQPIPWNDTNAGDTDEKICTYLLINMKRSKAERQFVHMLYLTQRKQFYTATFIQRWCNHTPNHRIWTINLQNVYTLHLTNSKQMYITIYNSILIKDWVMAHKIQQSTKSICKVVMQLFMYIKPQNLNNKFAMSIIRKSISMITLTDSWLSIVEFAKIHRVPLSKMYINAVCALPLS